MKLNKQLYRNIEGKRCFLKEDDFILKNILDNRQKSNENGGISNNAIYLFIKKYARITGLNENVIQKLHPYYAKHSAITMVVDKVGVHKAVFFARHSDPKTTMRYNRRNKDLSVHGTDFINYELSI